MRIARWARGLCVPCLLAIHPSTAIADAPESLSGLRRYFSGEVAVFPMGLENAYFGSPDQPGGNRDRYQWGEGWVRLRARGPLTPWLTGQVGGVATGTLSTDPYGDGDDSEFYCESLELTAGTLRAAGWSAVVGRQNFRMGDGFLLDDGYSDNVAAQWNVPLRFWDGGRVVWQGAHAAATGFAYRSSPSFERSDGVVWGMHTTWARRSVDIAAAHSVPDGGELPKDFAGAGLYFRNEHEGGRLRLASVRGATTRGAFTLAGEFAEQWGSQPGVEVGGHGYHIDLVADLPFGHESFVQASYFRFSGDDPVTSRDESFAPWNYGSLDWSLYYLGELVGSTMTFNENQRTYLLESGFSPAPDLWIRAYVLRFDADQLEPLGLEGIGRHFADEVDLAFNWARRPWTLQALVGRAWPYAAGKAIYGDRPGTVVSSGVLFAF